MAYVSGGRQMVARTEVGGPKMGSQIEQHLSTWQSVARGVLISLGSVSIVLLLVGVAVGWPTWLACVPAMLLVAGFAARPRCSFLSVPHANCEIGLRIGVYVASADFAMGLDPGVWTRQSRLLAGGSETIHSWHARPIARSSAATRSTSTRVPRGRR